MSLDFLSSGFFLSFFTLSTITSNFLMCFIHTLLRSRCFCQFPNGIFNSQGSHLPVQCHSLVCMCSFISNEIFQGGMSVPIHFCRKVGSFKRQPVWFPVSLHGSTRSGQPERPRYLTAYSIMTGTALLVGLSPVFLSKRIGLC